MNLWITVWRAYQIYAASVSSGVIIGVSLAILACFVAFRRADYTVRTTPRFSRGSYMFMCVFVTFILIIIVLAAVPYEKCTPSFLRNNPYSQLISLNQLFISKARLGGLTAELAFVCLLSPIFCLFLCFQRYTRGFPFPPPQSDRTGQSAAWSRNNQLGNNAPLNGGLGGWTQHRGGIANHAGQRLSEIEIRKAALRREIDEFQARIDLEMASPSGSVLDSCPRCSFPGHPSPCGACGFSAPEQQHEAPHVLRVSSPAGPPPGVIGAGAFCSNCGTRAGTGARFCVSCGTSLL